MISSGLNEEMLDSIYTLIDLTRNEVFSITLNKFKNLLNNHSRIYIPSNIKINDNITFRSIDKKYEFDATKSDQTSFISYVNLRGDNVKFNMSSILKPEVSIEGEQLKINLGSIASSLESKYNRVLTIEYKSDLSMKPGWEIFIEYIDKQTLGKSSNIKVPLFNSLRSEISFSEVTYYNHDLKSEVTKNIMVFSKESEKELSDYLLKENEKKLKDILDNINYQTELDQNVSLSRPDTRRQSLMETTIPESIPEASQHEIAYRSGIIEREMKNIMIENKSILIVSKLLGRRKTGEQNIIVFTFMDLIKKEILDFLNKYQNITESSDIESFSYHYPYPKSLEVPIEIILTDEEMEFIKE